MQSVVYADILIFINTVVTFLILLTTADFLRIDAQKVRYLLGSFIGGVFSLIIFAPQMNFFLVLLSRALICILIVLISFNIKKMKVILRCMFSFILISFLYSGVAYFIFNFLESERVYQNNGYFYFEISTFSVIIISAVVFIAVKIISRLMLKKTNKDLIYDLRIIFGQKEINVSAFFDTGNSIKDSFTGRPVILISMKDISALLDENDIEAVNKIIYENDYSTLTAKMRLIPVKSLGEFRLFPAFTVDKAIIENSFIHKSINNPSIVICTEAFENKEYNALLNKDIVGEVI